jgi:CelD/BcsL family acetyltransferase involved in cellulose biosynthesis
MVTAAAPATSLGRAGLPTADARWIDACLASFELVPHLVEVDGGLAPLHLVEGRLELIGASILFEPADLLAADAAAADRLVDRVADLHRPLLLHRVPAASPVIEALRERMPIVLLRDGESCPVVDVTAFAERTPSVKRRLQDIRRARRRAEAFGTPSVTVLSPDDDEVDAALDCAFEIEQRSWKGQAGTALAQDQLRQRFYRRYCRTAARSGALRVALLRFGAHVVAMQLAVEQSDAIWLLKIGYDAEFAAASPGQILMFEMLERAAEQGLERYEFLGTAKPWTRMWTREEWPCTTVVAYPRSRRGLAALARDGYRRTTRRARR